MTLKLNIGDVKTGKSHKKDLSEDDSKALIGKKIGDKVKGDALGFAGYEFEITGGSDSSGFPMRRDVSGGTKKRVLITGGVGFKSKRKGLRKRRTVAGNTIYPKTVQVNLKVVTYGKGALSVEKPAETAEGEAPAAKVPKEVSPAKEEQKAEEPKKTKEEPKAEEKPEETPVPTEEKKEEPKQEEEPKEEIKEAPAEKKEKPSEAKEKPAAEEKSQDKKE